MAEQLARFAERLGGALTGTVVVAGVGAGGLVQNTPPEVMAVESALSGILGAVAPMLGPYGSAIQAVHQGRQRLMYGDQAPSSQKGPQGPGGGLVRSKQALSRRARLGEPGALAEVRALREGANRGDPTARKALAVLLAIRADDSARIDRLHRGAR